MGYIGKEWKRCNDGPDRPDGTERACYNTLQHYYNIIATLLQHRCIMLYRCTAKTLLMLAEKLSKPVERSRLWHRSKGGMDLAAPAAALDVEHAQEQAWKII